MASNINPNNINGAFPVAGVDNDSQGFRSNFTNIKNNMTYAKEELTDLQAKAVLKSALTGQSIDNNMAGTALIGAEMRNTRETKVDFGTSSGNIVFNYTAGSFQSVSTNGSVSISFTNFPPSGKLGRLVFEINVTNVAHTLTLPATVVNGLVGLTGYVASTRIITFSQTGNYLFEFVTDDAGTTVHVNDLSRARNYVPSTTFRLIQRTISDARGVSGDVAGMISVNASYVYVCTGTWDGTTLIWKRATLSSF